ncbi:MAG: YigZ family protein [Eubacterium sp.]|nr:YigZ family protein [Eubacterium sp.]
MSEATYRTVKEGGSGEIVEKKSRFIATVKSVSSEEEATAFINEMKKKYWDARHNCSAFVIGEKSEITRCSDDGEPSGTAGRPMLDVLLGENIHNAVVVVTRYFGGVLLGTGGLVRAYQAAVREGIKCSRIAEMEFCYPVSVTTDYNGLGKIEYIVRTEEIMTTDTRYTENVEMDILVPGDKKDKVVNAITEATGGAAKVEIGDGGMFEVLRG